MTRRPCLDCQRPTTNPTRCGLCTRKRTRQRGSTAARGYGTAWQQLSRSLLAGQVCRVCGHPGSPSNPLTLDHITPKSRGGTDHPSNLQPLCRQHNSQKGNR